MPHIVVKLVAGKTDEQKKRLTDEIAKDVMEIFGSKDEAVSVAFEEFALADWAEMVYKPDIRGKWETLTKEPGYDPFAK